jgi:hypothetical protein
MSFARYYVVRGNVALWNGDPAAVGTEFRQVVVTSNQWNDARGAFQVYALKGIGDGLVEGNLSVPKDTFELLFDQDFEGFTAATDKAKALVEEYRQSGFSPHSFMDEQDFQSKVDAEKRRLQEVQEYVNKADALAQECVNVWGRNGGNKGLSPEFLDVLEKAFKYRTARDTAENRRQFNSLSERDANNEKRTRLIFAEAYKKFEMAQKGQR